MFMLKPFQAYTPWTFYHDHTDLFGGHRQANADGPEEGYPRYKSFLDYIHDVTLTTSVNGLGIARISQPVIICQTLTATGITSCDGQLSDESPVTTLNHHDQRMAIGIITNQDWCQGVVS